MKQKNSPPNQNPNPAGASRSAVAQPSQTEINVVASADEVARRAYFSYVNQDSPSGRDVQHWLEAEAELIAERNLTRVHGFHHDTQSKAPKHLIAVRNNL